ncbi:helix-turn-helix domain-containing protein [Enterococcus massiliensis]|uniref:helix-turn-helix domain-containing protein n=1 Tax=Enterococcus massiliensis TaxID=1640685 RepID=UPI00065DE6E3|nr:helix-turn-helix domain-containing protein [Enterococcus massiliensis]
MYLTAEELQEVDHELFRKVSILEILADGQWLTVTGLSRILSIDTRSVGRLIHELTKEYHLFTGSDLALFARDKRLGYRLLFADNELEQEQFLIFMIRKTLSFQLLEEILAEKLHSLQDFSENFYISETTAHRKVTELKKNLARYGLALQRGSYQLIGDEKAVRMYLSIYYWRLFRGKIWPFPQIDRKKVAEAAKAVMAFFGVAFHDMKKRRLEYLIAASLMREAQQHHLPNDEVLTHYLKDNQFFAEFSAKITTHLPLYHRSKKAVGYLYLALLTREEYYQQPAILAELIKDHQRRETRVHLHHQRLTDLILADLGEDPVQGKKLLQQAQGYLLSGHLFAELFPTLELGINATAFWTASVHKHPELIQWVKNKFELVKKETNDPIFSMNKMLFRRYLTVLKELSEFMPDLPQLRILLLTDLPLFEEDVLIRDLRHFFKRNYQLIFFRQPAEEDCDLCLTTSYLLWPLESGLETLLITQELKIDDYLHLMEVFEAHVEKSQQKNR